MASAKGYDPGPLRSERMAAISAFRMEDSDHNAAAGTTARSTGTQTLTRALDILDAIAERPMMLPELAIRVGLSTTTCYRLASALVARGLLASSGRSGYSLGGRVGELGSALEAQQSKPATK